MPKFTVNYVLTWSKFDGRMDGQADGQSRPHEGCTDDGNDQSLLMLLKEPLLFPPLINLSFSTIR